MANLSQPDEQSNLIQVGPTATKKARVNRPFALQWTANQGAQITITCDPEFDFDGQGAPSVDATGTGNPDQKVVTPTTMGTFKFTIRAIDNPSDKHLQGYSLEAEVVVGPDLEYPPNISDKSKAGIDALVRAMNNAGFMGEYGRATLLGIAGGESHWIPQQEGYYYSRDRLLQIFPFLNNHPDLINQLTEFRGPREQFFSHVYGTTLRGRGFLGNQNDADGGRFYGRGFIQLTGRGNYTNYGNLSGHRDLVDNPELLDADVDISAAVAMAYLEDRCHADPATQAYVEAGIRAVGVNSPDIKKTKLGYVDFFMKNGTGAPPPVVHMPRRQ